MDIKDGIKVAGFSTLISFFLAILKGAIGFLTGATILVADAIHSFSDTLIIASSYLGLHLALRKPTDKFPYGLYKAETLITFFISLFLFFASYSLFREGIEKIKVFKLIKYPSAAISITVISAIVSFFLSKWQKKVGRKINSSSLEANGEESFADVIISSFVLAGIIFSAFKVKYVEGIGTTGMAVFIFYIAFKFAKISLLTLLDASINPEIEEEIKKVISENKQIKKVERVKLRQAGPFYFGEVNIQIDKKADVERGHQIAHDAVRRVKEKFPFIEAITVHIEPYRPILWKVMLPVVEKKEDIENRISTHFARTPFFLIIEMKGKNIRSLKVIKNTFRNKKIRTALSVVNDLVNIEKIDAVVVKEIGEIAFHSLRDSFIEIYRTEEEKVNETIKKLIEKKLPVLIAPTHLSDEKVKEK